MTFGWWKKQYQAYKDDFDLELILKDKKIKYSELNKQITIDDVIPF